MEAEQHSSYFTMKANLIITHIFQLKKRGIDDDIHNEKYRPIKRKKKNLTVANANVQDALSKIEASKLHENSESNPNKGIQNKENNEANNGNNAIEMSKDDDEDILPQIIVSFSNE